MGPTNPQFSVLVFSRVVRQAEKTKRVGEWGPQHEGRGSSTMNGDEPLPTVAQPPPKTHPQKKKKKKNSTSVFFFFFFLKNFNVSVDVAKVGFFCRALSLLLVDVVSPRYQARSFHASYVGKIKINAIYVVSTFESPQLVVLLVIIIRMNVSVLDS